MVSGATASADRFNNLRDTGCRIRLTEVFDANRRMRFPQLLQVRESNIGLASERKEKPAPIIGDQTEAFFLD
jgi:hypothetical protein